MTGPIALSPLGAVTRKLYLEEKKKTSSKLKSLLYHLHFLWLKISRQIQHLQDDEVSCFLFLLAEK